MITPLKFDSFYSHEELTALLRCWASERPNLMDVDEIGRSWQGREILMATVTSRRTGPHQEKPALLVEANIHSAELTSSFAALHFVHTLLARYDEDPRIRRLLDSRSLYVVPRLNPDGAETVLREGRYIRSSPRPHPSEARASGLHWRDVDGDGRMLFMRQPDPQGPWKRSERDPRLLVRREPDEFGGEYFRLFIEGEIEGYDGETVPAAETLEGLDLGMNFQTDFVDMPTHPRGAGPFSGSEPEIHAMMRAATDRPNITGYFTCHTFGALHLHPPINDDELVPDQDWKVYREVGAKAAGLTGYTTMSYEDLKHAPYRVKGGQINWFYHEIGVYSWITEFWNPVRAAGITPYHPAQWLLDHSEEEAVRLIEWSDRELGGHGFVDWYAFDHPQLGPVELGGWDIVNYWYNPPLDRVEAEVAPHTEWLVYCALSAPELVLRSVRSEEVAPGVHRVRAVVANDGWLPTYVTQKALDRELVGPVVAELVLGGDVELVAGAASVDLGHLEGRSRARTTTTWWGHDEGTPDRALAEWVVRAPAGTPVTVVCRHPRAGTVRRQVSLG